MEEIQKNLFFPRDASLSLSKIFENEMHFSCHIVTLLRFATLSLFTLKSAELSEGRHVIAEKVERADELVGLGCSEHSVDDDDERS